MFITNLRKRNFILVMALLAMSISSYAVKVNLNFFVSGGKVYTASVEAGETYVISEQIPEDTIRAWFDCRDYRFVGWKLGSPVKGNETPAMPTEVTPVANVNLHAVFNKDKVNRFERITTIEELEADNEYLIVSCRTFGGENRYYAMNGITGTYAYDGDKNWGKLGAELVVPQNGFITNPGEGCVWTISSTSTAGKFRISIGNNGLYVGNNRKYWMLNNPASSGTKNIITAINGEFRIKTELQEITKHKADTLPDVYDYIIRDTVVNGTDTNIIDVDTIEVHNTIIIPAYEDTAINTYYLKYVDEEITTRENFFITGKEMNNYPLYLFKKESSYTSTPDCDKWTTHLDAVEGAIGAPDGPKTMDMTELYATWGLWRQNPAESGLPKAYMPTGSCEGWDFAGWALESPVQPTTTRPTMRPAGQEEQMYNGEKLYAVYAKGIYYEKVSSVSELKDGDVCVIVRDNQPSDTADVAVTYNGHTHSWKATPVNLENETIKTAVPATSEWTYRSYDRTFWNGIHPLAYGEDIEKYPYTLQPASEFGGGADKFWMRYSASEPGKPHWLSFQYNLSKTKNVHWLSLYDKDYFRREDKGNWSSYVYDYWEYKVFRKTDTGYERIKKSSNLNDGDVLVLVLVSRYNDPDPCAVTYTSSYYTDGYYRVSPVTLNGDELSGTITEKMEWTYNATDGTLSYNGYVLSHKTEGNYVLAESSETKNAINTTGLVGTSGRFWLRYVEESVDVVDGHNAFRVMDDESNNWKNHYWQYDVYHKNSEGKYAKISSTSELVDGENVVVVMVNDYKDPAPVAIAYTGASNKRWDAAAVTISEGIITSPITANMKWKYNASDKSLSHDGQLLAHEGDAKKAFTLHSTSGAPSDLTSHDAGAKFWLRYEDEPQKSAFWLTYDTNNDNFCDKSTESAGNYNKYWQYSIYRKAGTAQYSSYPHCAPYKITLHACGGSFSDNSTDIVMTEDHNGAGIILPTCTPNCTEEGWEFVGWFQGESKNSFERVEFHDYIAAGTRFIPTNDGVELFALYKKTTDKFTIVRGVDKIVPGEGEDYLITFYTHVDGDNAGGNTKYYDYEISGQTKRTKLDRTTYDFCVGKRGESPQNGEDFYMLESDSINMWRFTHVSGEVWNIQNVKTGKYLKLGTSGSSARCEMVGSPYELHILDAGRGFEVNICRLDNNKYYTMYCHKSGVYTTESRKFDKDGTKLYLKFNYVYRRVKEFSSWPHCEKFSVHFEACGGTCNVSDLTETVSYGGVVAPEGHASVECAKLGWQFAGWLKRPLNDEIDELTFDLVPGGSTYHPASTSDTLYAVYQQKTDKYKRVTGISSLYLGGRYIVATAPNASRPNMALSNTADSDSNPRYVTATQISPIGDTVIINENQALDWTLKGQWGEYVFYNSNRNVYLSMKEPSLAQLTPDEQDQVDITYDVEGNGGYKFRSVQNITHNDGGNKFLTYSSSYYRTVPSTSVEPLAMYRQQCYYISYPICHQEVDAIYWEKADNGDVHVTVESYMLKKSPDMHNSMGSPELQSDGTYRILLNSDLLPPCSRSLVTWHGATAEIRVPFIVNKDITSSEILGSKDCDTCDVYVMDGNTLTIDEDRTVRIMTLHNGAKLNIQDGKRLRVQQLVLFADGDRIAPEVNLNNSGTVVLKNGELYYDRRIDENRWYWLSLPFDADLHEITYANEEANGGAPVYYRNFWLKYYDGAQRAADVNRYGLAGLQDTYWTLLANPGGACILNAGQGYQFGIADQKKIKYNDQSYTHTKRVMRFTMHPNGYSWNNEERGFDKTAPIVASEVNEAIYESEAGWNLIGNPYMRKYNTGSVTGTSGLRNGAWVQEYDDNGVWTGAWVLDDTRDKTVPYLTVYDPSTRRYSQFLASNYEMRPAEAVFVQVNSGNRISFASDVHVDPNIKHSPRRYDEPKARLYTGITLDGNGQTDRTGVVLDEEFTPAYEIGGDLAKQTNSGKLNLYTLNSDNRSLAFNAMSDEDAEQPIPVGVTIPADGSYTFSFDAEQYRIYDVDMVQLIDYEEQTTADLLHGYYTFNAKSGRNDKRFALIVRRANRVATGLESGTDGSSDNGVFKFVQDGVLYINRDGRTYDVFGNQVK